MKEIRTRGNVIVNDLKIGDEIVEIEYGNRIVTRVKTLPKRNEDGLWEWKGETPNDAIVDYAVHEDYPHYAPNLYTN